MAVFDRITIVGLGLIGGSLGMAIRRKGLAREVVGFSRKPSTLREAKRRGAIDQGTTDARAAVDGADLVVLATPVDLIVPYARRLARSMKPGSILMDVGSTKAKIVAALDRGLNRQVAFVGAHPVAGSEQRGIAAADAALFDGSVCILTPTAKTRPAALRAATRFWRRLNMQVVIMSPAAHDQALAAMSHLPHALAFCLAGAISATSLPQTPRSFLDMTRIAQSDPELWDDIFLSNRRSILAAMDRFTTHWRRLRGTLSRGDRRALRAALVRANARRDALS